MTVAFSNFSGVDLAALPSIARGEARAVRARCVRATEAALAGYGHLVDDFATAALTIVPWPVRGPRPLVPGTGAEGGAVEDRFVMERRGQVQYATNYAVGRAYVTGWFEDPPSASEVAPATDTSRLYTHEANYHPDGGQIFFPEDGAPFVALLARPGDDVQPDDFVAFQFDGSRGLHVDPGVWHQPVFPLAPAVRFENRQGRVHACVSIDFVGEFGVYVEVPLGA
ncbi:MAG: ureidoglycolate lyase [Labilithrix sp.]|nr:ureidoglycolate lyase [Labilithrix sp.]